MALFISIVHILVCFILILVILLQAGRGQGLSFGGGMGGSPQSLLGTKSASFMTKLTTISAILFLFTCIGLNVIETSKSRSLLTSNQAASQIDFDKIKQALEDAEIPEASEASQVVEGAIADSGVDVAGEADQVTQQVKDIAEQL